MTEERGLRERFERLRGEVEQGVPSFGSLRPEVGTRRGAGPLIRRVAAAAAITVVAIGVWWVAGAMPEGGNGLVAELVTQSAIQWEAPTDFLLRTPGARLLESVPAIGSSEETSSNRE